MKNKCVVLQSETKLHTPKKEREDKLMSKKANIWFQHKQEVHGCKDWLRWGRTSKSICSNPCSVRDIQSRLLRPLSRQLLRISKEDALLPLCTTRASSPSPAQHSTAWCSSRTSSLFGTRGITKSLVLSSLCPPFRYLYTLTCSSLSLL